MSTKIRMRVSLEGQCRHAADVLDRIAARLRQREGWDCETAETDDPADGADYYAMALRELADHAAGTRSGKHSVADFADHYCLAERRTEA